MEGSGVRRRTAPRRGAVALAIVHMAEERATLGDALNGVAYFAANELSEFHLLDWKGSRDREGISTGTPYKYSYGRTHSLVQLGIRGHYEHVTDSGFLF